LIWVDAALEYVADTFGDSDHYMRMRAECNDRFLVAAFISATEHYVYNQLEVDINEGDLSKRRIRELIAQIKRTEYDGEF
jgi:hypothetical protein